MRSFYLTDAGKVRDHNEDSVIIIKNSDNELVDAARHPKEILRIPCDKKVSKNDLLRVNFLG